MVESTRSLGSISSIPSEVRHLEDLGRSKSPDGRASSGVGRNKLHGHGHGEEELPGSSSARSFSPSLKIQRQVAYLGEIDRVRISLDWFDQEKVLGMPPGHDPRQGESTMLRSVCWIGLCFFIHRQVTYEIGFDRSKACPVQVKLRDGPARPSGSIPREEELTRMRAACSFGSGFRFHQPSAYLGAFDRGKSSLVQAHVGDGSSRPSGGYPRKKKLTRVRAACSFGYSFSFHQPSAYVEALGQGKSRLVQAYIEDGPARPSGGYPRKKKLTRMRAACSFGSSFNFHQQSAYWEAFDRGKSSLVQAHVGDGSSRPSGGYPRKRNSTHSKAACSFGSYFRICWQNTPKRVFDRGKSVLDRADLRVGLRGPIPPYTGRSKRQAPLRHWDREFLPPGHVLMKSIRPLEALATPLHVARPRAKKFGLTGEVLAFSLKLLLFPFDPGIIFMLCLVDTAELFPIDAGLNKFWDKTL